MNGVFIDSNVFLGFLEGKERAKALLEEYLGLEGCINDIVDLLGRYRTLEVGETVNREAEGLITRYGLLPNDALIAATCKHYGILKIATFDPDFARVDFLEVID